MGFQLRTIYWISQVSGWLGYVVIAGLVIRLAGSEFNRALWISLSLVFLLGVGLSHLYRQLIIILGWLRLGIAQLIPRVVLSSVAFACLFHVFYLSLGMALAAEPGLTDLTQNIRNLLSWTVLFLIWSLIYFAFHFFRNYRKEEIKNLKWEATKSEIELNKIKSQLNPHFMFNAMNSIRALVDEEPAKAKQAITQLSNILRTSLLLGKKKEISFEEEMKLITDYISIETTRFEERLKWSHTLHPESGRFMVPPLMIQTLVENGIKHGISNLPEGGLIDLTTDVRNNKLHITIRNSGEYDPAAIPKSGFGLKNTKQRLSLLYGKEGTFSIRNENGLVITELTIPEHQILPSTAPEALDANQAG